MVAMGLVWVEFVMASHKVIEGDCQSLRLFKAKLVYLAEDSPIMIHRRANVCTFCLNISSLVSPTSLV